MNCRGLDEESEGMKILAVSSILYELFVLLHCYKVEEKRYVDEGRGLALLLDHVVLELSRTEPSLSEMGRERRYMIYRWRERESKSKGVYCGC